MTNLNRPSTLTFRMNGASVCARLPDPRLARQLAPVYGTCLVDDAPPGEPDIVVRRDAGGFRLERAGAADVRVTIGDLLPEFEWALTLALLGRAAPYVHLHAAGAVLRGHALLAVGPTGAGKSTLALHWSQAGTPALGDDTVLLDDAGRAHPFPRLFKVDPAAVVRAGIPLECTPWWVAGSAEAWYDPSHTSGWARPAPIALVALVERGSEPAPAIRDVTRAEGLAALLQSCQSTGRTGAAAFDGLARAASGARFVALRGGRSDEAASLLMERLP